MVEPDTGLITDTRLTPAAGAANSDAAIGIDLLAGDDTVAGPVQVLGDSVYGTGEALAALVKAGHLPVIKPWPLRPADPRRGEAGGQELDRTPSMAAKAAAMATPQRRVGARRGWG